jgi:hypothetical protein
MTSMREHRQAVLYGHSRSKERRAEEKNTTRTPVDNVRARHNTERTEMGNRHRRETEALNQRVVREKAADTRYGEGKGSAEYQKQSHALAKKHERERTALRERLGREMTVAAAKQKLA